MSTVAFPGSDVGTGQCLELLPEPASRLGVGCQQLPGNRVTAASILPMLGVLGGGGSLLELIQERCLALSKGKEKQAVT